MVVGQWRELDTPGYLEIDLVSHSGEVAAGEWIWTLCATDLSTGWTELVAVMGKGQTRIVAALEQIRCQLPFPLLGLRPDNGSEFSNWHLVAWCQQSGIALSRSRPELKNDNCHVEQKNWTLVRRLIGYQRLDTPTQLAWLNALYSELRRPYNNCFQPVMKLVGKQMVGTRTRKTYDRLTTPLRRVLASAQADPTKIQDLVSLCTATSPLTLKRTIGPPPGRHARRPGGDPKCLTGAVRLAQGPSLPKTNMCTPWEGPRAPQAAAPDPQYPVRYPHFATFSTPSPRAPYPGCYYGHIPS